MQEYLTRNHSRYAAPKYFIFIPDLVHQPGKLDNRSAVRQTRKAEEQLVQGYIVTVKPEAGILPKSLQLTDYGNIKKSLKKDKDSLSIPIKNSLQKITF